MGATIARGIGDLKRLLSDSESVTSKTMIATLVTNGQRFDLPRGAGESADDYRERMERLSASLEEETHSSTIEQRYEYGLLRDDVRAVSDVVKRALQFADELDPRYALTHEDLIDVLSSIGEMLDDVRYHDRDRRSAEVRREMGEGYCRHGVWVGGVGVDWMCGACESDEE